jgi:hypothetical protein
MHQSVRLAVASACSALWLALTPLAQSNPAHACTWLGGSSPVEQVLAVAVAANGDLVVAGRTGSADFPVSAGAFDPGYGGGTDDAFVARLSADCSQVLAATFLGGSNRDRADFVQVASDGTIWVGGTTRSPDYPTTVDALMTSTGSDDAFVARFDGALTTLLYSTVVGNPTSAQFSSETGNRFAIDEANQLVYVLGTTDRSWSLPISAVQSTLLGNSDFYLVVLDLSLPTGTFISYATLFGGNSTELNPGNLTLEGNGIVTWSGGTLSSTYPTTPGAVFATNPSGLTAESGVITRFDTSPTTMLRVPYSTYFGGSATDRVLHATDPLGTVHVLLHGNSSDVPLTANAFPLAQGINQDAFFARIDPQQIGSLGLLFSSRIVVQGSEQGRAIRYANGKVAMFLSTSGFGLPTTAGAFQATTSGNIVGFVMELDVTSQPDPFVTYASAYGAGFSNVAAQAMAYDGATVALGGDGSGNGAPLTANAVQLQALGNGDGFVGRLGLGAWPSPFPSFGTACAGTAGTPQLQGTSPARLGRTLSWAADTLMPNSIGIWVVGSSRTQHLGLPLPASLLPFGAPGCEVSVAPETLLLVLGNASGVATFAAAIPVDPMLLDLVLFVQHAQLDAAANLLGLVTSNGIGVEVRW